MEKPADHKGLCGELCAKHSVLFHSDETEPHLWDYTFTERFGWAIGFLFCEHLDQVLGEVRHAKAALH